MPFFTTTYNVANYLGYFCKELCSQELSKITQSGHAVGGPELLFDTLPARGSVTKLFRQILPK